MSFQWIFDGAESLSIDSRDVVAQTQSRSGIVRSVRRGTPTKKFEVRYPDGPRWSDLAPFIQGAENFDRYSPDTITIKYSLFPWYYEFQQPASDDSFTVICVDFPQWKIFKRNQVSWSGPFRFVEVT